MLLCLEELKPDGEVNHGNLIERKRKKTSTSQLSIIKLSFVKLVQLA